jgi:hypothetical protein
VRVKHLGQEFVPIKRLFRCAQISNEKSSCKSAIYESVGLYVGQFVECLH